MGRQVDIVDIVELTPNEVVQKVNDATSNIVRSGCVDAQTIYDWDDAIGDIRDAWKGKPDKDRGVIFTEPVSGEFPVVAIHRGSTGKYKFVYEDTPV
jgi:hypothetical protein